MKLTGFQRPERGSVGASPFRCITFLAESRVLVKCLCFCRFCDGPRGSLHGFISRRGLGCDSFREATRMESEHAHVSGRLEVARYGIETAQRLMRKTGVE